MLLVEEGRPSLAQRYLWNALFGRQLVFGPDDVRAVELRESLAAVYRAKYGEHGNRSVRKLERRYAANAQRWTRLLAAYQQHYLYDAAYDLMIRVVAEVERRAGVHSREAVRLRKEMAEGMRCCFRADAAVALVERNLAAAQRAGDPAGIVAARIALATAYIEEVRPDVATELLVRTREEFASGPHAESVRKSVTRRLEWAEKRQRRVRLAEAEPPRDLTPCRVADPLGPSSSAEPAAHNDRLYAPRKAAALQLVGWFATLVGVTTGITSIVMILRSELPDMPWWGLLAAVGFTVENLGMRARIRGRRYRAKIAGPPRDGERFVLYLRSFDADQERGVAGQIAGEPRPPTLTPLVDMINSSLYNGYGTEEYVVEAVRDAGRMIAVGLPGELEPPPGAERLYLPADDWQNQVRDLLVRARLVLIVLDATPGTVWEFVEATRCVSPERLVLLVVDEEEYRLFREQATVLLRSTAEQVRRDGGHRWSPPRFPEYRRKLLRPSALRRENGNYGRLFDGLITYSSDWRATYVPLSTALGSQDARLLRHDMAPVLARLFAYEARQAGDRST